MDKTQLHEDLLKGLHELYIRKNTDYGDSATDTFNKYGLIAYLVRMEDKMNRLRSLATKEDRLVEDERIEDTLLDLANYAIMAVMDMTGEK